MAQFTISTIGKVCDDSQYGYTTKAADHGKVKFVRTTDISDGTLNWESVPFCLVPPSDMKKYQLKKGDVLICRTGSVGLSYLIKDAPDSVFASYLIRYRPKINSKYFYYFLKSPMFWSQVKEDTVGVAIPNLNATKISAFRIPICEESEQIKLVKKIDSLFAEIDKGVIELENAKANLELYRQSVLNAAIQGKLVPQDPNDEPASKLLEKIRFEKEKLIAAGKLKKERPLTPIELDEVPFELPTGWKWVRLEELSAHSRNSIKAGPFGSSLKKEFYVENGFKVYGQEQVIKGDAFFGNYFINEERYQILASNSVESGDILISLVGTVGKVLILPDGITPGIINPRLIKISPHKGVVRSEFLKLYLESSIFKQQTKALTKGTTMDVMNLGILKSLYYPLPPFSEQQKIVSRMQEFEMGMAPVEELITRSKHSFSKLKQSILKKAFDGELV